MTKEYPWDYFTDFRCCLCPNDKYHLHRCTICPPFVFLNKPQTICRFVVAFLDDEGHKVFVSHGIATNKRRWVIVQKNGKHSPHRLKKQGLPACDSFDKAQSNLNAYATENGWKPV
jgi:hypothetical protein